MTSDKVNLIYQRFRELCLENQEKGLAIPGCGDCGMDHGIIEGEGEVSAPATLLLPNAPDSATFTMRCQVCGSTMMRVVDLDSIEEWFHGIATLLAFGDLAARGVYGERSQADH